jgi:uncharacterized protein (DUF302 family)
MTSDDGIVSKPSPYSVTETLDRLETVLRAKSIKVFARVDHSGEAEKVGMKMPPTQVLIFGNPKGGTPVMIASPKSAIDLPLKVLAWEDNLGKTWISYQDPEYFRKRFNLSPDVVAPLAGVINLIDQALT